MILEFDYIRPIVETVDFRATDNCQNHIRHRLLSTTTDANDEMVKEKAALSFVFRPIILENEVCSTL